jgi:hypothetical protein
MLRKYVLFATVLTAVLSFALFTGCGSQSGANTSSTNAAAPATKTTDPLAAAPTETKPAGSAAAEVEHPHKPGAHGGLIVEIGRDSYHAEAVFEKGGQLRLYMLGKDEGRVQEVELQTLTAYVKPISGTESTSFTLKSEPQADDAEGRTSLFVGALPEELAGQLVAVTIPSIRIAGERFRLGFQSAEEAHGEEAMPQKTTDAEERALYLTPGGKYTAADIAANDNMTASQKFDGAKASHDLNPKPGDKICPITLTKANPKFTWIVGGKSYEFCCPPCIDEFVKLAKDGGDIKSPEEFRKQ